MLLQKDGQFHGGRRGESIMGQWWEVVTQCRSCEGWRLRARSCGAARGRSEDGRIGFVPSLAPTKIKGP